MRDNAGAPVLLAFPMAHGGAEPGLSAVGGEVVGHAAAPAVPFQTVADHVGGREYELEERGARRSLAVRRLEDLGELLEPVSCNK